ncbi:hypothetical protein F4781DRAFT_381705 [Annulohypoxylon bovei var. microspora]|nr:hypothetical protein F4781DRAFT_381705 [Annulohypoxylon bovei var. microspora]
MCPFRKTIYQCNHSVISPLPLQPCQEQKDYKSGLRSEPCTTTETHRRNNIKVPHLCPPCHERKITIDKQFDSVKERLAKLKEELKKKHDQCLDHLDEAGLHPKEGSPSSSPPNPSIDAAEEFLKKKRQEEHAHLMMFWDYR